MRRQCGLSRWATNTLCAQPELLHSPHAALEHRDTDPSAGSLTLLLCTVSRASRLGTSSGGNHAWMASFHARQLAALGHTTSSGQSSGKHAAARIACTKARQGRVRGQGCRLHVGRGYWTVALSTKQAKNKAMTRRRQIMCSHTRQQAQIAQVHLRRWSLVAVTSFEHGSSIKLHCAADALNLEPAR